DIDLPEYSAGKGEFLTLGPKVAEDINYSEGTLNNRTELLHELDLSGATVVETETSLAEEAARFLTNPVVIPILLSIASLGLVVELYFPCFGVFGFICLFFFFFFFFVYIIFFFFWFYSL